MLLVLDVGNTNIVLGAYEGDRLVGNWRIRTDRERTTDEHGLLITHLLQHRCLGPEQVTGFAISNVVPTMTDTLANVAKRYFGCEPVVVGGNTELGIAIHCHPPSDVGADRLVNAIAAHARYKGPAIIVDLGTATTVDAINENGDYLGGAIAPGIGISSNALFRQASRLYRVELTQPSKALGVTTSQAMQSGIVYGFAGMIDALVNRISNEMGNNPKVIATGGLAELMRGASETLEIVDPLLTLEGLRLIWERNQRGAVNLF